MTPFLTEQNVNDGQDICKRLVSTMQQIDPKTCIVGLAMTCIFAADAAQVPLESIFQFMRDTKKGLEKAAKDIEDKQPKLVVP